MLSLIVALVGSMKDLRFEDCNTHESKEVCHFDQLVAT